MFIKYSNFRFPNLQQIYLSPDKQTNITLLYYSHQEIWGRFYKVDSSRNRDNGGTGIGLALVKAIMNNYQNDYGVINHENGVEFYFELDEINYP